jgi:hypothetical protein
MQSSAQPCQQDLQGEEEASGGERRLMLTGIDDGSHRHLQALGEKFDGLGARLATGFGATREVGEGYK